MGDKNADIDVIGGSHLPADLFTQTLGSNYGLDGYPDMQYGMGVLDGVLEQDAQDAPALPSGVQKGAAAEMDLKEMLGDKSLADLDWLDPEQPQDPERLPHNPVDLSIPELVEAWGVNHRTDGIHTAHQVDLDYVKATQEAPQKQVTARTIEKVVTHAMRRSIEGQHIDRVVREAAESMGDQMERVVPLLRRVKAEHGLAGNVFIRAASYPGWGTGKWKDHAKKYAAQARYLLVSERDLKQASWIQDGRCIYTGKKAVAEIPWQEAHRFYMPRLEATGRSVAAGDLRESLRAAFLSQPRKQEADAGYLPTHETPDQRITSQEARAQFAAYQPERVVHDRADRENKTRLARVSRHLARMERDHLLPYGERDRILASGQDPITMLRTAAEVVAQVKTGTYRGDTRAMGAQSERWERQSQRAQENAAQVGHRLADHDRTKNAAEVRRLVARVEQEIERGARGSYLRKFIAKTVPAEYANAAVKLLAPTLKKTGALEDGPAEIKQYDQPVFSRAASEVTARSVLAGQIKSATAWVRKTMSEGFAGKDLDALIANRFAKSVLDAAGDEITQIRQAHEGLSGFLYVDAEVYASEAGVKGCEAGAVRHRANQIPNVRAMSRCGSCTLARVREDGTRKCGTYNKTLVEPSDVAGSELDQIKQANIASCNMTDAEATASLFAPSYDPSEFGLVNSNLEGVSLNDLPNNEQIADILFDGWKF